MTLAEMRRRVAEANQTLISKAMEVEISRIQARGERGVLEPSFVGTAGRSRTERQNSIEQTLSQNSPLFVEDSDNASAGVEGTLPWGARYWVGARVDDLSNNLTNFWIRTPYRDEYLGFAGVRLTQPLLKNAWLGSVMARARLADVEVRVKQQELRKQMMAVVSRAELAYWNLALSQRMLEFRKESLRIAEQVLQDNRERVKAGKMPDIEIDAAEAGAARRRAQVSDAAQTLAAAVNVVRTFLSETTPREAAGGIETADEPRVEPLQADVAANMERALASHPDYLAQREIIRQEEIRLAFNRWQRWPQLDLSASYGLNGIGETFSDSFEQIGRSEHEAWSVGIELRVPLGGGARERADLAASKARKIQALIDLKTAEIEIANALDTALRRVAATQEQSEHSRTVVEINERLLASELARLEAGKSDSRRVLEVEQDLVEARLAHAQGLVEHRRAWLDWEVAQGILLEARGMEPEFRAAGR